MELIMSVTKHHDTLLAEQATLAFLKGQVLSKIKLYGIPVEAPANLDLHELCDILNTHEAEQIEVSKSIIKIAEESLPQNISTVPPLATIHRLNERVKESPAYKVWEQSLFDKADKYNIPYDVDRPDVGELADRIHAYEVRARADKYNIPYGRLKPGIYSLEEEVDEWESLLKEAERHNIPWEPDNYDTIGLQQAIETAGHQASREQLSLHHYY